MKILSIIIFLLGYLAISQEHVLKISKTAISLIMAVVLWILVAGVNHGNLAHALSESAGDIFQLVIFLLSAMTLVEIMTHFGFFDYIYAWLIRLNYSDRTQFYIITILAFIFSSFLDNLTTTIVFVQIAGRFFRGKNLLRTVSMIVIASNAGGAFSPLGDVTTTMLWLAGKFSAFEVLTQILLPSIAVYIVSSVFIGRKIVRDTKDKIEQSVTLGKMEWFIIGLSLLSFLFPLGATFLGLPPYFGLIFGLGIIWLIVDILRVQMPQRTNLSMSIEKFFQRTDIASLYFFIGILLAVRALSHLGVLEDISRMTFRENSTDRIITGSIVLGSISSILDNIPLTAAAIEIIQTSDSRLWTLLAYAVGVGGSMLLIGSAPGVVAMAMVKELTFTTYFKIATLPAFLAFAGGIFIWYMQFIFSGGHL